MERYCVERDTDASKADGSICKRYLRLPLLLVSEKMLVVVIPRVCCFRACSFVRRTGLCQDGLHARVFCASGELSVRAADKGNSHKGVHVPLLSRRATLETRRSSEALAGVYRTAGQSLASLSTAAHRTLLSKAQQEEPSLVHRMAVSVRLQQVLQRTDGFPHSLMGRILDGMRQDLCVHKRQRSLQALRCPSVISHTHTHIYRHLLTLAHPSENPIRTLSKYTAAMSDSTAPDWIVLRPFT